MHDRGTSISAIEDPAARPAAMGRIPPVGADLPVITLAAGWSSPIGRVMDPILCTQLMSFSSWGRSCANARAGIHP
jgi:hypothetical protein